MENHEISDFALKLITDGYNESAKKLILSIEENGVPFYRFLDGFGAFYHDDQGSQDVAALLWEASNLLRKAFEKAE